VVKSELLLHVSTIRIEFIIWQWMNYDGILQKTWICKRQEINYHIQYRHYTCRCKNGKWYHLLLCFLLASPYIVTIPPFSHSVQWIYIATVHYAEIVHAYREEIKISLYAMCRRAESNPRLPWLWNLKADAKPTELRRPSNVVALIFLYKPNVILLFKLLVELTFYTNDDRL
jgi:hypothetical protein